MTDSNMGILMYFYLKYGAFPIGPLIHSWSKIDKRHTCIGPNISINQAFTDILPYIQQQCRQDEMTNVLPRSNLVKRSRVKSFTLKQSHSPKYRISFPSTPINISGNCFRLHQHANEYFWTSSKSFYHNPTEWERCSVWGRAFTLLMTFFLNSLPVLQHWR